MTTKWNAEILFKNHDIEEFSFTAGTGDIDSLMSEFLDVQDYSRRNGGDGYFWLSDEEDNTAIHFDVDEVLSISVELAEES